MTQDRKVTAPAPVWVWPVLLFGAAVTLAWAWFIIGFLSEPSAVGRVRIVLLISTASSLGSGLIGVIGAIGLVRRERWARTLAAIAAAAMTLTGVGAIAGIPALIGLVSSRNSSRN
jgi:hypothetical protein